MTQAADLAASGDPDPGRGVPEDLILRLADLPAGYVLNDSG